MSTDVDAADIAKADLTKWPKPITRPWIRVVTGWNIQEYEDRRNKVLNVLLKNFASSERVNHDSLWAIDNSGWPADEDTSWIQKLAKRKNWKIPHPRLRIRFYIGWTKRIVTEANWALASSNCRKSKRGTGLVLTSAEDDGALNWKPKEKARPVLPPSASSTRDGDSRNIWNAGFLRITLPQSSKPKMIPFAHFRPTAAVAYSDYASFQHETFLTALRSYHVPIDPIREHTLIYHSINGAEFDLLDQGGFHCALGDWGSQTLPLTGLSPLDVSFASSKQTPEAPNSNMDMNITRTSAVHQNDAREIIDATDSPTKPRRSPRNQAIIEISDSPTKIRRSPRNQERTYYHDWPSDAYDEDEDMDSLFQPQSPLSVDWSEQERG